MKLVHLSQYIQNKKYTLNVPSTSNLLSSDLSGWSTSLYEKGLWYQNLSESFYNDPSSPKLCIVHFTNVRSILTSELLPKYNALHFYWIGYSSTTGASAPDDFPKDPHYYWISDFYKIQDGLQSLLEDWERRLALDSTAAPIFTILERRSRYWMYRFGQKLESLALQGKSPWPDMQEILADLEKENPQIKQELAKIFSSSEEDTGSRISQILRDEIWGKIKGMTNNNKKSELKKLWIYNAPDNWKEALESKHSYTIHSAQNLSLTDFLQLARDWEKDCPECLLLFLEEGGYDLDPIEWIKHLRFDNTIHQDIRRLPVLFFAYSSLEELREYSHSAYFLLSPGCRLLQRGISWEELKSALDHPPKILDDSQLEYFAHAEISHLDEVRAHELKNRIGPLVLLQGFLLKDWQAASTERRKIQCDAQQKISDDIEKRREALLEEDKRYWEALEKWMPDRQEIKQIREELLQYTPWENFYQAISPVLAPTDSSRAIEKAIRGVESIIKKYDKCEEMINACNITLKELQNKLKILKQSRKKICLALPEKVSTKLEEQKTWEEMLSEQETNRKKLKDYLANIGTIGTAEVNIEEIFQKRDDCIHSSYKQIENMCEKLITSCDLRSKAMFFLEKLNPIQIRKSSIPGIPRLQKIVYIDDEADHQWADVLKAIFGETTVEVYCPNTEELYNDILEKIKNNVLKDADLVLLDLWLKPKEDSAKSLLDEEESYTGMDILKEIRSNNPYLPVVIFSAADQAINYHRLQKKGASGFYFKGSMSVFHDPTLCQQNFGLLLQLIWDCELHQELSWMYRNYIKEIEQKPNVIRLEHYKKIVDYIQHCWGHLQRICNRMEDCVDFLYNFSMLKDIFNVKKFDKIFDHRVNQRFMFKPWFDLENQDRTTDHSLCLLLAFPRLLRNMAAHEENMKKFFHIYDCFIGLYCVLTIYRQLNQPSTKQPGKSPLIEALLGIFYITHGDIVDNYREVPNLSVFMQHQEDQEDQTDQKYEFKKYGFKKPYPQWRLLFTYLLLIRETYQYFPERMKVFIHKRLFGARLLYDQSKSTFRLHLGCSLLAVLSDDWYWPDRKNGWLTGWNTICKEKEIASFLNSEENHPEGRFVYLHLKIEEGCISITKLSDEPPDFFIE